MSLSSKNAEHFFQTTTSVEEISRKSTKSHNKNGNPRILLSKLLAIIPDPLEAGCAYVAESAGTVKRIILESGKITRTYTGPTAPLTCICLSPDGKTLFAGCWDKTIWSWNTASRQASTRFRGHIDFVKSVLNTRVEGKDLLISGAADAEVFVWDVATSKRLHVLKGHTSGVNCLVLDPTDPSTLFTASSDRSIRQCKITPNLKEATLSEAIIAHETGVYGAFFDEDGDLWTASADKTVKCLVREREWKAETSLEHPDFVRDVAVHERGGLVVTACRDEEVRVWDRGTGKLVHTYSGHFEEVTGLLLDGWNVYSVSIDATIRQWSLKPADLQKAVEEVANPQIDADEETQGQAPVLTEEEERELAELMADD